MSTRSPITWSAPVGRYSFEVSVYSGSYAQFTSTSSKTDKSQAGKNATSLRAALAEEHADQQPPTLVEAVEKAEHSADAVTDRVEHADKLFKAVAEGRLLDPRLLTDEIGSLLGLLDRLDGENRFEEEIRVAKALHGLCVLAFRWIDLVRSLRRALAAAAAIGDEAGRAWALNELGALHLCAGDAKRASEHLGRASELYEKLGDAAGRCATRHNFDSARRDVARPVQLRAPRRLLTANGSVRPLLAGVVGATMLAVLGLAFAPFGPVAKKDDKGAGHLVATIGARPSNPSAIADATFSFSAEGAQRFACKLDDRRFERCSSPVAYTDLDEGEHIFRVRATAKGEQGSAAKYVWRIDLTAPTTTITDQPPDPTAKTGADFSFTAGEEVKGFECELDDGPFTECTSPEGFPGPLEDGKHEFAVRAVDLAGNVGTAATYRWSVSVDSTTRVPNLVGRPLEHGIQKLADADLEWELVVVASRGRPSRIVGQNPHPHEDVEVGSTVTVEVPEGTEIAVVPSVVGLSADEAVAGIEGAGLRASIIPAESTLVPEGLVSAQNPGAGTELAPEATVEITVSLGSGLVELPDLTVRFSADGVVPICQDDGSCVATTVTFTVTNQSKVDVKEPFDVLVSDDLGNQRRVPFPDGLAAGAPPVERTMQLKGIPSKVTVEVDPDGRIPELDEENNVATWPDPVVDVVISRHVP